MKTILYLASVAVAFSLSVQSACAQNPPASPSVGPVAGQPWTNSLGVKFVPAGTDGMLFSVWDVRVKDFKAFVDATGYDATAKMVSLDSDGWKARGDTWKSPGFAQTDDHPVVGVNWHDAKAFCVWLTKKEQAEGKLGANQQYRLPSDAEWSNAVGLKESSGGSPKSKNRGFWGVYPWGSKWPPPKGGGNYAGSEARDAKWPSKDLTIAGYDDGYPRTSPVGSFDANVYGLYDMGGNVWQWCEDPYYAEAALHDVKVQRGCSWGNYNWDYIFSSGRNYIPANNRVTRFGFRVVVVVNRQADEEAAMAMAKARNACVERTAQREAEAKAKPTPANTVVVVNATDMSGQGGGAVENKVASKRGAVGLVFSTWDAVGHWIEWTFTVPAEGYYNLTVCYCSSQDNVGERIITINGEEQEPFAPLLLPVTGGWSNGKDNWTGDWSNGRDNWRLGTAVNPTNDKPLLLKLKQGTNVIRLNNSNGNGANLNYIAITSPDVAITRELLASKAPPGVPPPPRHTNSSEK